MKAAFFSRILKILKISGKVAEVAAPVVVTIIDPPAGAAVEATVKIIETETEKGKS